MPNVREFLTAHSGRKRTFAEYCEQTAFFSRPLIKIGDFYVCAYPALFYRAAEHLIHDKLKEDDCQMFMEEFGNIFENYVDNALAYSDASYVSEAAITPYLPPSTKVVDFVLNDGQSNVFIDAKGVEMADSGKTTHLSHILKSRLKTSIIKAVQQAVMLNNWLAENPDGHPKLKYSQGNFLLVVTYKQLYVGDGVSLKEMLGEAVFDSVAQPRSAGAIPPENMYFITIEDLDVLVQHMKTTREPLCALLEQVKGCASHPRGQRFVFDQYLSDFQIRALPSYLNDAKKLLISNTAKMLGIDVPVQGTNA